jgi:single-strand DNA-binding protein
MSQLNRVILMGHLGAAPELKQTADGVAVLKFRLATNEAWFDRTTKALQERVEWHDVTVFGARAEGLSRILEKGDCVGVEGALRTSSWEKDGVKRYRTEVIAQNVVLTGKRGTSRAVTVDVPPDEVPLSVRSSMNGAAPAQGVIGADVPF